MANQLERLGRRVAELEAQVKDLMRQPQLGHSSIEGGAIEHYTPDGTLGTIIGGQPDGTNGAFPVSGPVPSTPGKPTVEAVVGGLRIHWDGTYVGEGLAHDLPPMDFSRVEVHVSAEGSTANFPATMADTLKTTIESSRGGEVLIPLAPTPWYVRLVVRTIPGKRSLPSAIVGPVVPLKVRQEDLGFDLADLSGNTIYRGPDAPDGQLIYGDLWLQTPENIAHRWEPPDPGHWEVVRDLGVTEAIDTAFQAQATADTAGITANDAKVLSGQANTTANNAETVAYTARDTANAAQAAADLAQSTANQKVTVYRQISAPTGGTYVTNDLWLDTDDNNKLFAWSGTAWELSADQRIAVALTEASDAQTVAAAKTTLFGQASQPTTTGRATGDTWIDTDDGNKVYVWDGTAWTPTLFGTAAISATARSLGAVTTYRQASAPTGILIPGDLWIDSDDNKLWTYQSGAWVESQDVGIQTALSNAATAQNTANAKTTTFYQISAPATTGRVAGDLWVDTDDGNKIHTWSGSAWTATLLAAQALSATARQLGAITIYRQASQPGSGMVAGDYWIDSDDNQPYFYSGSAWVVSRDTAVNTALNNAATAQSTADGKMRVFSQPSAPSGLAATDVDDVWIDTDDGNKVYTWSGTAWTARRLGNSAIQPNSLIASDVIATGTVRAALLESIMVLGTTIIAGNPDQAHAKLDSTGVYVYRDDPVDGVPNEAIRLGTATNDLLGVVNTSGLIVAQVDETGGFTGRTVVTRDDPTFMGTKLTKWLGAASGAGNGNNLIPGAQHWIGWANGAINGVTSEVGLVEMQVSVSTDRWYWIGFDATYRRQDANEIVFRIRDSGSGVAPLTTSTEIMRRHYTDAQGLATAQAFNMGIWYPTTGGVHRLLLTATTQAGGVTDILDQPVYPAIIVIDMGPRKPIAASVNRGNNASQAAPLTQYYLDLVPDGWQTFNGSNVERVGAEPTQGYDPGGSGDNKAYWWFPAPTINVVPDRVEFYFQVDHTHYPSGGTAVFNITRAYGGITGSQLTKEKTDQQFTGLTRGGTYTWTLPSNWWASFKSDAVPRARGITIGPGGGSDLTKYMRFKGSAARLRIWYTQ